MSNVSLFPVRGEVIDGYFSAFFKSKILDLPFSESDSLGLYKALETQGITGPFREEWIQKMESMAELLKTNQYTKTGLIITLVTAFLDTDDCSQEFPWPTLTLGVDLNTPNKSLNQPIRILNTLYMLNGSPGVDCKDSLGLTKSNPICVATNPLCGLLPQQITEFVNNYLILSDEVVDVGYKYSSCEGVGVYLSIHVLQPEVSASINELFFVNCTKINIPINIAMFISTEEYLSSLENKISNQ